jgi:hypothetical protein
MRRSCLVLAASMFLTAWRDPDKATFPDGHVREAKQANHSGAADDGAGPLRSAAIG